MKKIALNFGIILIVFIWIQIDPIGFFLPFFILLAIGAVFVWFASRNNKIKNIQRRDSRKEDNY